MIGQTVTLDGTPYTVVGVLPANVQFPFVGEADIWLPRYFEYSLMSPERLRMGVGYLGYLARLRPGTTPVSAEAELALLNQQYREQNPTAPDADPSITMTAQPLRDLVVSDVRGKVLVLSAAVAVVNESFARRFWPDENPVGKHVGVGRWTQPAEVVGVAADVKNKGLAQETQTQVYIPFPQLPWGNMNLLVRTAVPPLSLTSQVRAQIAALDPDQPVTGIQTIDDLMDGSRAQPRFTMLLLGGFSMLALVLAAIGIYGVLAYSVAGRRRELGIRMALGAERSRIVGMVLREGLTLAVGGIAIGLLAALLLTKLLGSLLYKTGSRDLETFVLVPLLFLAIALVASYLPARRATKVNPVETLRSN